jgi:hypothetical protein
MAKRLVLAVTKWSGSQAEEERGLDLRRGMLSFLFLHLPGHLVLELYGLAGSNVESTTVDIIASAQIQFCLLVVLG